MFDLRSARYFIAVAEELHFGRAAARLLMSQPPLSQAIKQLERDVGATLLDRTNRTVSLTPAGAAFLDACRRLVQHAEDVANLPRVVAQGFHKEVSIGAVASALQWPLPQAIALLQETAPGVTIRIYEIDTDEAVRGLKDGNLDVAIARLATSRAGIRTHVILREEFVLIAPTSHPASADNTAIDLASLADDRWVGIARDVSPDYHDEMSAAFRAAGFSPRMHHTARSIGSQIAIVATGVGISIVPRSAARSLPSGVSARPTRSMTRTVMLAITTRDAADPYEELVRECIEDAARSMPTN